jgi:hypothetical protein
MKLPKRINQIDKAATSGADVIVDGKKIGDRSAVILVEMWKTADDDKKRIFENAPIEEAVKKAWASYTRLCAAHATLHLAEAV